MKNSYLIVSILLIFCACGFSQIKSPQAFMPHNYGSEFTPHHRLVDYFEYVAEESPLVSVEEYGRTNQNRPLIYAIITSEKNRKIIEDIRLNHLRHAGMFDGEVDSKLNKSIVWLSFGVHGNEAGASESSMQAVYSLISGGLFATKDWLENTIVIIDPCINPDGFNRYTHWNINNTARHKNPHQADNEHKEPWPSGRVNHFYHDLNRDWAWASQKETKARLNIYHEWLPHLHADFHEMYPESPYYFAPAAEPFHEYISDFQRNFQITIGKNHAGHFDKNNWLYYTREQFDLFYPSYGDTYPTFNGAIGMTYEQAGHGVSGRAILLENGDTLTLQDRIDHHTTTALSTIEAASNNQDKLTEAFSNYFNTSQKNSNTAYENYIIRNNNSSNLKAFLALMDRHHIKYAAISSSANVNGYVYKSFDEHSFSVEKNDIFIPGRQPHGTMAQVLLEPKSTLSDSVTYDITAWSLLYAYGLDAVATNQDVATMTFVPEPTTRDVIKDAYAYVMTYDGVVLAPVLSHLQGQGVRYRIAQKDFKNSGHSFTKGSVIITRADNSRKNLVSLLTDFPNKYDLNIYSLYTGFSDEGPDIGSDEMKLITPANILLVGGEGTDQYNYGQIWQYLDQDLGVAYTSVIERQFHQVELSDYKTIILPAGYYPSLNEKRINHLKSWVRDGGKLILFGSSINALSGEKKFPFKLKRDEEEVEKAEVNHDGDHKLERYETSFRKRVSHWMPGAIVQLKIDDSHPLGFGLGDTYASLKLSSNGIPYQDDTWNVGYIKDELHYTGFIGNKVKPRLKNSSTFFVKDMGQGTVIGLIDNPLYRSFWHQGRQIVFNAIFMVD